MKPILYIIIPCYNEQDVLPVTSPMFLKKIEDLIAQKKISDHSKIMFVNDGSKDNTYEIVCEMAKTRPLLIPLTKPNGGHGSTVLHGYRYAIENNADYIFQTDSDG